MVQVKRRGGGQGPVGVAGRLASTGVALGVTAGAAWALTAAGKVIGGSVSRDEAHNPRLLNWDWARTIATKSVKSVNYDQAVAAAASRERVRREYVELVERSVRLVSDYTGIQLEPGGAQVHVFNRAEWVDANVSQFRLMFGSLDEAYATVMARAQGTSSVGVMGQVILSSQMGVLLRYLARRVLGQYDLSLLGREPVTQGQLYFVEPNIAAMEQRYRLPSDQFRFWIALHEVTHAFEFEAHPWVREYLNELLTVYLRSLSEDFFGERAGGLLGTLARRIKDNASGHSHFLELMMSRDQRRVFRALQALMALMEGYSNHVMQQVGDEQLQDHQLLKRTFESRARNRGAAEQLFIKLTGLDIKLEQYALGERFCQHIVDRRGIDFMNRVWESRESLPTLEEIHEPNRWLERQSGVPV